MEYIDDRYIQKKYTCKKCGNSEMALNIHGAYVMGYRCIKCGAVNHPVRDMINRHTSKFFYMSVNKINRDKLEQSVQ